MSAKLPQLIERALQRAADATAGAAAQGDAAASSAPRLYSFTHFQGCLAAVLQYDSEHALPPASRIEAELQQLLPGGMQLVRVSLQEVQPPCTPSSSSALAAAPAADAKQQQAPEQQQCGGSDSSAVSAGGVWPWADPVALGSDSGSCIDVALDPRVLQQLPGAGGEQPPLLRVVLAVAGGEVLSDGIHQVEGMAAGCGGTVQVRAVPPPPPTPPPHPHPTPPPACASPSPP